MATNPKFFNFDAQDVVEINEALVNTEAAQPLSASSSSILRSVQFSATEINDAYRAAREEIISVK